MGGRWEYVLEFLCCFFALSDDDGWEKTTHELMVLYGDDEMVMPFNTHTHKCQQLSLQWSLSSSCSLVDPFWFVAARYKREEKGCCVILVRLWVRGLGGVGVNEN